MFNFLSLKKSITGLGEQAKSLATEIEQLKRERERLGDAPLTRTDYKRIWNDAIDAEAKKYVTQFDHTVNADRSRYSTTPCAPLLSSFGTYHQQNAVNPAFLYFALAPQIKAAVANALDQIQWPSDDLCGPSPAERETALVTIDAKIATLELQQIELLEAASAAGIDLAQTGLMPPGRRVRK